MYRRFLLPAALLFGVSHPAFSQWRCDCTTVVDSCSADVTVRGNWIDIQTDHQQCARVDYFIDGLPFVAMVVEGEERQNWIAQTENPEVLVQSCQVCLDNSRPAQPAAAVSIEATPESEGPLRPLIRIEPEYPAGARSQGIEGSVTVEFIVGTSGEVADARVMESSPAGVFDQAALAAVRRWRYPADSGREATLVTERMDFALTALVWQLEEEGSSVISSHNDCVREGLSFDYGEMVEVGLINACSEPLLVFGCAVGTSQYAGKWTCIDSEQQEMVLLRQGDGRMGTSTLVSTPVGPRSFSYEENLYVARAPNTQYWWIACRQDDGACRDSARTWVRSVHSQLTNVSPGDRASVAVARSF